MTDDDLPVRFITNTAAQAGMWEQLEEQAGERGHAITEPPPRSLLDEIGTQNPERAEFLLRTPGLAVGVNDLVLSLKNHARRLGARPSDLRIDGAQVSSAGVFSCSIRRVR